MHGGFDRTKVLEDQVKELQFALRFCAKLAVLSPTQRRVVELALEPRDIYGIRASKQKEAYKSAGKPITQEKFVKNVIDIFKGVKK